MTPQAPSSRPSRQSSLSHQRFDMIQLILKRRRYEEHLDEEIEFIIKQFTQGSIPDYQMAAWLMAVCCGGDLDQSRTKEDDMRDSPRGLTAKEIATLTRCLVESGQQLQWRVPNSLACPGSSLESCCFIDKHSTGGVGDKVSIVLAPLLAACGESLDEKHEKQLCLRIPMLAGRGLGHTGGTIDKLEAIPNFRTNLTVADFQSQVMSDHVGCSIASASAELVCPADQKLYALRDVTGTVSSLALQTASIMSKKIAEGPDALLLDCKYGRGSFQETIVEAEQLAETMVATGQANGIETLALLTRMDAPLGRGIGNWLEVVECIEIMRGDFSKRGDLVVLIVMQAAFMMRQSGQFSTQSIDWLAKRALDKLENGEALGVFRQLVQAQGGDVAVVDDPTTYPLRAKFKSTLVARQDGYVSSFDALLFGQVAVRLGAGRLVANESVDACAGIWLECQVGDAIKCGDIIAQVYTNREGILEVELERLEQAIQYSSEPVAPLPVVSKMVSQHGAERVVIPAALMELVSCA